MGGGGGGGMGVFSDGNLRFKNLWSQFGRDTVTEMFGASSKKSEHSTTT